jgi:uncharacterized hydrophobic protein (TIGR00271 family)
MQSPKTLALLLAPDLPVALQLRWAERIATARGLDLLILHRVEGRDQPVTEVGLDEPPSGKAAGVVSEIQGVIADSPGLRAGPCDNGAGHEDEPTAPQPIHVRLMLIHFAGLTSLRRAVLAELEREEVVLFTQAHEEIAYTTDVDLIRERRLFLRYIPCEVILCLGLRKDHHLSRILVAAEPGKDAQAAIRLGAELASAGGGTLTALQVNPGVGADAERVGARRLARLLDTALGSEHPAVNRRVVVDDKVSRGIRAVWDEGQHDVVVVGAPGGRLEASTGARLGKGVTVVMVSNASPIANRFKALVEGGLQRIVPQIGREERIALVDRVQSSAAWNFDFLALMLLSTTMAAVGLIQNSAAVVIGAMLVAPLMTPLLGLGLALVQGNPVLARLSVRSVVLGLGVALLCGLLVGALTPGLAEPTREMLARGGPGLLDLVVAFAAGLAAAYASSRPGLIAALPGVAIAAALVPPIATSGLALSLADIPLAIGALLLFLINMVVIVLASMISLWLVGIRNYRQGSLWTRLSGGAVIVATLALGVHLSLQPPEYELAEELPAGLEAAVQESLAAAVQDGLGPSYRLEDLAVAYDELGVQLNVQVVGEAPAPRQLATAVRTMISDQYDDPVRVRLLTRIPFHLAADESLR